MVRIEAMGSAGTLSGTLLMRGTIEQKGAGLRLHLCCRCLEAGQPNPAAGTYSWTPLRGQRNPPFMTPASGRHTHVVQQACLRHSYTVTVSPAQGLAIG